MLKVSIYSWYEFENINSNLQPNLQGDTELTKISLSTFVIIDLYNDSAPQIDELVQERRNSSVLAMELCLSFIYPSKCAKPTLTPMVRPVIYSLIDHWGQ